MSIAVDSEQVIDGYIGTIQLGRMNEKISMIHEQDDAIHLKLK
jgi:hypothetical protein